MLEKIDKIMKKNPEKRPIVQLDQKVANRIAAGEVIERPSAIVKELIENSIDASATRIEVCISDGGKSFIQVKDNGWGMTKSELPLSVCRHATSKLVDNNLSKVNTYGFRGEALPSIGATARLRVQSSLKDSDDSWEIYVSSDMAAHVFETIMEYAKDSQLKLCGMHMMDSCRIEKGYRHFGHDITCEDHVLEAGLGFAVKSEKQGFLGRDAVIAKKEKGLEMRMAQFLLKDAEPLLYHNEPIVRDGEIVGYLSSGNYGHALGGAVGMGYVPCKGEKSSELLASSYEIDVAGSRVQAEISFKPLYDPTGARTKA